MTMQTDTLWCVHAIGPDDIHAAPDFATAQTWAVNQNQMMDEYTKARGMENDPHWVPVRCVVALWPWSAASHADDLPNSIRDFAKSNRPILLAKDEPHAN